MPVTSTAATNNFYVGQPLDHDAMMNPVSKSSTQTGRRTVTVLIDNAAADNLQSEHGVSLWLEWGDKRVLFDTGQTDMILGNARTLGIHLESTDAIVLSHGHYDHTACPEPAEGSFRVGMFSPSRLHAPIPRRLRFSFVPDTHNIGRQSGYSFNKC
jgi:hypothetical protein